MIFTIKTDLLLKLKIKNVKFLTLGDIPVDHCPKLVENLKKEEFDILILLGDYAYELHDDFG